MKSCLLFLALVGMVGCGYGKQAQAQEKWVSACSKTPDICKRKIIPMTATEIASLKAAAEVYKKKEEALHAAADEYNAAMDVILKAHHADHFNAVRPYKWGNGTIAIGGTCMGTIEMNDDGYILYTPASDISQCGDYRK